MKLTSEQKYQLLLEISQKIRDTLDLDEIMAHLLDTIKTVVDYDAAGIFMLNKDMVHRKQQSPVNVIAGINRRGFNPSEIGNDEMFTLGKGIIGHVIHTGKSRVVPDVRLDEHYISGRKETLSEIAVPILRNERALGALNLESDHLNAFDKNDLEVLQFFADEAAIALEKAMLHRQLLEKKLLDKQLQIAREMQMGLLPVEDPDLPGYDIAGICVPAEGVGGDYYDYLQLAHGNLGLAVADVSGHGIASAMIMTAFRGLLRTNTHGKLDPARISRKINGLLPEFTGDSHFITAIYGVLNSTNDEVTFVSCGHPSPFLLHLDGRVESLQFNGPAMGIFEKTNYVNETIELTPGDILVIYTDGVTELENPEGEAFEVERLIDIVTKNRALKAAELVQLIIQETQAFSGYQTYEDDFTLVIAKRNS